MQRARQALGAIKTDPAAIGDFYEAVCRDIVEHVGATRASVWSFNTLKDAITSECLVDSRDGSVSRGVTLKEEDFGAYFHAIRTDLRIVAPDALTHPATSCFDEIYFTPLDIRSLLDYVVLVRDEPAMVLCCEHCGEQKPWSDADVEYLHQMAAVLAMAQKAAQRKAA
jgi:GAF domain-containing protein